MDSITHICLGAVMGDAMAGRKVGKYAMLVGAAAQSLPDFDFITGLWLSPSEYFLAHRGLSHSFLFITLTALLLPLALNRLRSVHMKYILWVSFIFLQLLTHILIDSLNAYGIGWFEPFGHERLSFDVLFVVDPLFTIGPFLACIALLIVKRNSSARIKWTIVAIVLSVCYTLYAVSNKIAVDHIVKQSCRTQKIAPLEYFTTPTPLNSLLWYVVIDTGDGYLIGYRSVFDRDPFIHYNSFARNDSLLDRSDNETQRLIRLARRFYVVQQNESTLIFSCLRFGEVTGWENSNAGFIFQYNIARPNSPFTIQKGRFSGWNKQTAKRFFDRIKGN